MADVEWVNVFAMFGSECSALELSIGKALDTSDLPWLAGRRPRCEAMFQPRISGLWSVFLVVGDDGQRSEFTNCPAPTLQASFSEFLRSSPAFVLANGAERLWPSWADWQRLVAGSFSNISLCRLPSGASSQEILREVRAGGVAGHTLTTR